MQSIKDIAKPNAAIDFIHGDSQEHTIDLGGRSLSHAAIITMFCMSIGME